MARRCMPGDPSCFPSRIPTTSDVSSSLISRYNVFLSHDPLLVSSTTKDVVLPLMWPIKSADGKSEIHEIPLRKNTDVVISIHNANRCKAVWGEDAYEWKPERWLGKSPDEVANVRYPGVYSSM